MRRGGALALRRQAVLALVLVLVFLFLALRVLFLQIFDFERYQKKVFDQLTTESRVNAARGEILDSAGRVLAPGRTVYKICLYPSLVARAEDGERVGEVLAEGLSALLTGISADDVRGHLSHTRELSRTLAGRVNGETARAVITFVQEKGLYEYISVEAWRDRY